MSSIEGENNKWFCQKKWLSTFSSVLSKNNLNTGDLGTFYKKCLCWVFSGEMCVNVIIYGLYLDIVCKKKKINSLENSENKKVVEIVTKNSCLEIFSDKIFMKFIICGLCLDFILKTKNILCSQKYKNI